MVNLKGINKGRKSNGSMLPPQLDGDILVAARFGTPKLYRFVALSRHGKGNEKVRDGIGGNWEEADHL